MAKLCEPCLKIIGRKIKSDQLPSRSELVVFDGEFFGQVSGRGEEGENLYNILRGFQGVVVDAVHLRHLVLEHAGEIVCCRPLAVGRGGAARFNRGQCADIHPPAAAFRTLVHFHFKFPAEAMTVQQGALAFGADMLAIAEGSHTVGPGNGQQAGSRAGQAFRQSPDLLCVEPITAAPAIAGLDGDPGHRDFAQFIFARRTIHSE